MYLEHFRLKEFPFTTAPDPRFFYPTAKHREALACLLYAVEQRKGFALISGEVGAGKTMLCRAALDRLCDKAVTALIVHTSLSPKQFLQAICSELHLDTKGQTKIGLINAFKDFLFERKQQGQTVVLIVDEAQGLSPKVLEEVRLLGNLETSSEKLVQVILVGQPELRRLIGTHQLRQLEQRIAVKFHLGALSWSDVDAYIDHRLRTAGSWAGDVFDDGAKLEVFRASGGVPRLINIICDQALLQAYVNDEHTVSGGTVRRVILEREGYYMDKGPHGAQEAVLDSCGQDEHSIRQTVPRCRACGRTLSVSKDEAGRAGPCPACTAEIGVPADVLARSGPES